MSARRSLRSSLVGVAVAASAGCGGSDAARPLTPASLREAPAPSNTAETPSAAQTPASAGSPRLPMTCSDASSAVCTPPAAFVDRLCAKPLQDVTLSLFSKETPFTRLYLRGKLDELDFDEEVLALRFRAPQKGGMVVGNGSGTYDLLRWDGTCSKGVEAEMVSPVRPSRPRSAHVQWHRIGSTLQDALIARSEPVKRAHAKRGKECQGAMSGDVSKACEGADQALVDAIVDFVRIRGGLPEPDPPTSGQ